MTHRWDDLWPGQEPPPGFAERVVGAVAERRASRRRALVLSLAALVPFLVAAGVGALGVYRAERLRTETAQGLEAERARAEVLAARAERLEREVQQARAERDRREALSAARPECSCDEPAPKPAPPPRVAPPRPHYTDKCSCDPNDSLCPCL